MGRRRALRSRGWIRGLCCETVQCMVVWMTLSAIPTYCTEVDGAGKALVRLHIKTALLHPHCKSCSTTFLPLHEIDQLRLDSFSNPRGASIAGLHLAAAHQEGWNLKQPVPIHTWPDE